MAHAEVLKNIYLFKELDEKELSTLAGIANEKNYPPGEYIFNKGDNAHSLYVIRMGSVKITSETNSGKDVTIANLGSGSHFGEMAFLDNEKRSATAVATEASYVVEIKYDDLKKLIASQDKIAIKIYKSLATYTCGRLRVTTQDLNYARENNLRHF